jgi:hypothetical protein
MSLHHHASKWHIGAEIRKVFHLTVYFGVWFTALNFLLYQAEGRGLVPLDIVGFVWIKAAICAKFLLVGQLLVPMPAIARAGVWRAILPRSIVYLSIVVALSMVEEGVRGALHGQPFMHAMREFGGGNPLRVLGMAWVYWLILVPYLALEGLLATPEPGNG